jgi:phage-related protein
MPDGRRRLFWEGSSKKDLKSFPTPVQKDFGVALFVVPLGGTPPSSKPWKGEGAGVFELIEDYRGDTYRAVYTVRLRETIHVLHAFQKKAKSGIATPKPEIEIVRQRLRTLLRRSNEETSGD